MRGVSVFRLLRDRIGAAELLGMHQQEHAYFVHPLSGRSKKVNKIERDWQLRNEEEAIESPLEIETAGNAFGLIRFAV